MKVIFHPRFYEVYTSDPAAAPGRMEPMVKALEKEFEFIEPEPASVRDLERVHGKNIFNLSRESPLSMKLDILAAGGAILAAEMAFEANLLSVYPTSGTPCQSPFLLGFLLFQ